VRLRGEAMQQAVPQGEGAMAALLGVDLDVARAIAADAAQGEVCAAANDNAPGQVVISGSRAAVERALELAGERGAKRAILLPVSAPFHCALMAPAGDAMAEALAEITIAPPALPLVANVTAQPVTEPAMIRRQLVEQVTAMVRWRESVQYLHAQEVETVVELGHGKVLGGLTKRIERELQPVSVGDVDSVEAFLSTL
jgi:[acyl-carrier-protein] S-malonyltransferase